MKKNLLCFILFLWGYSAQAQIDATSYPFSYTASVSLEDMSSGTTQLIGPNTDDGGPQNQVDIGFDFRFAGLRYTQFHPSANGFLRLGQMINGAGTASDYTNSIYNQTPCVAPYWDDLFVGNDGKVHYKVTGTSPNRKCIIEWKNVHIPYNNTDIPGTATFQVWITETTGTIQLIYGNGIIANTANGGYTIGISSPSVTNLSVITNTNTAQSTQFNSNTVALPAGTSYTFTPNLATPPTGLNFTNTSAVATTLNWTDNAANETAYEIFRSDDGGLNYQFITQLPADATSFVQNLLHPATNYFYRVAAATSGGRSIVTGNVSTMPSPLIISNGSGGGNWNTASTWTGGVIPNLNDSVIIQDGDVVNITGNNAAYHITVGEGFSGALGYEPGQADTLTIGGSILIEPGGIFQTAISGSITTHVCKINKNFINNGTVDFSNGTQGTELIFFGTSNSLLGGTGPTTDLHKLIPAKATISQIIDLNLNAFSAGGLSSNATTGLFQSGSGIGTVKFSGTNTFSGTLWSTAGYTIPTTMGIWLNNPNFSLQPLAGEVLNNGLIRLSAGQLNIGSVINNSMIIGANSKLIIEGGNMNIAGRLDGWAGPPNTLFSQSSGILKVATIGNNISNRAAFDIAANTIHQHTGGSIIIVQPNLAASQPVSYRNISNNLMLNGGTVIFGSPATTGGIALFRAVGNLPHTIISDNTGGTIKQVFEGITPNGNGYNALAFFGALEVQTTALFNLDGYYCTIAGNVINNGIIAGGSINNTLVMTGSSNGTSYSGTGICGTSSTPIHKFIIDKSTPFLIDNGIINNIIISDLGLYNGAVINAHKLTLGTGGTSATSVTCYNGYYPSTLDQAPIFNIGTGGQNLFYYDEINPRTTGYEINPSRIINNLSVSNSYSDLTLAGGNLTVSNATSLSNRNINLGGHTLVIGSSPTSPGSFITNNEMVHVYNGKFARWVTATTGGSYFPVGNGTNRQGAFINYTTAPVSGGLLTGEWKALVPGNTGLPLTDGTLTLNQTNANGYWTIEAGNGLTGGVYYFAGTAKGLSGISDYTQLALVKRVSNTSPWTLTGTHFPPTGNNDSFIIYRTDLTTFSDFGIAGSSVALPLRLISFRGQSLKDYNLLQWETTDEKNVASFDLERSDNGINFIPIAEIAAKNSSTNSYRYHDYDVWKENTCYYRLKIIDRDASTTYSKTIRLNHQQKETLSFYPNPVQNSLNLDGLTIGSTIRLRNAEGKLLMERKAITPNEKINMQTYSKGVYLLQYVFDGSVEEFKVVKE